MKNLHMNVQNADSGSDHVFPWNWNLKDLDNIEKNNLKVFSCFSCGGGSSMGYKLAGYQVIGNCEIDPAVMNVYKTNHHPKYSFLMDVREFLQENLPDELFDLDVLDGSPPCSVFSMAGDREEGWNKEKVFREGQEKQRLDDLFFTFIDIAKRLQPKVVIAENVKGLVLGNAKGLVLGNAKGYVNEIIKAFKEAGYVPQLFLLNSASMGVPQARERVFFIAHRIDKDYPKLKLAFNEKPILFKDIRSEHGKPIGENSKAAYLLARRRESDTKISDINKRLNGHNTGFTQQILSDHKVAPTLTSAGDSFRMYDGLICTDSDYRNMQSFPQDYDFCGQPVKYICGMSVPPVMMAHIAKEVYEQWLSR